MEGRPEIVLALAALAVLVLVAVVSLRRWHLSRKEVEGLSADESKALAEIVKLSATIPREEVKRIKRALKTDRKMYGVMIGVMSHPAAVARVRLVPGTGALIFVLNILTRVARLVPALALGLLLAADWKWALASILGWFALVSPIQTALNYEVGARLVALDNALEANSD